MCGFVIIMTTPLTPGSPASDSATPDEHICPPDCEECAIADENDWHEIEQEHRAILAAHDGNCAAEAISDAFATGHDEDATAWFVAAQHLDDGHFPCRCGQIQTPHPRFV